MALPALTDWTTTRTALHQATQIIGAIRVASADALPNDLQYSVAVTDRGVSTTELNVGGELCFDFSSFTMRYVRDGKQVFEFDASVYSQQSLMQAVLSKFKTQGIVIKPSLKHITNDKAFEVDMALAEDYMTVLYEVYTTLARFRAKLSGSMTPIVIWPHHFDMAFIWFATSDTNEHEDPHLAIGFAPFSDGIARPYFYGYGWSKSTGYIEVAVDEPAEAISDGYTGLYLSYDKINDEDDVGRIIETVLESYHTVASDVLQ